MTTNDTLAGQSDARPLLSRVWGTLHASLSRAQTVVGLLAGLLSITGTVFSVPQFLKPAPPPAPPIGQVVAFVQDADSEKALPGAMIEILTPQNAIVATLRPDSLGRVRRGLKEGAYRVRASHAHFVSEVRQVQVVSGQTVELRIRLRPIASGPLDAVKRLFGGR